VPPAPEVSQTGERERRAQPYQEEDEALSRAQELIKRGDVSSARLLYEDLALSGSALGALALARTYDPDFLRSIGAFGMRPDLDLARKWYSKASELGNGEASRRLSELR
jgi:TPR repeat protein